MGYVDPVKVKVGCSNCGKLIRGHFTIENNKGFVFPDDKVSAEFIDTEQVVSISSELPIITSTTNAPGPINLTPFIALQGFVDMEKWPGFQQELVEYLEFYNDKIGYLKSCTEIFEASNWQSFLVEVRKHFKLDGNYDNPSFSTSADLMVKIHHMFFSLFETDVYERKFRVPMNSNLITENDAPIQQLKSLQQVVGNYLDFETEFIKGIRLTLNFLENIKSFIPVAVLSLSDEFGREFKDEVKLTTFEFLDLKDMYIEQFEYLSRISTLYFGLLNLSDRSDFNDFDSAYRGDLLDYCQLDNGVKKDIVKKSEILDNYFIHLLDNQIRNGIGHLKTTYDPIAQVIRYYPFKHKAGVQQFKEIHLIDFASATYQQSLRVRDSLRFMSRFFEKID